MKNVKLLPSNKLHTVPVYVGIIFCLLVGCLYGFAYFCDGLLPTPLQIEDEKNYPNDFIAQRASDYLRTITNIGSHPTGSYENEVLVVKFLTNELNIIKRNAHPSHKIEIDLGTVSFGEEESRPYVNLQNIAVKLYSENPNATHSLLVNAHFDSAPGSLGGSDDGINCAVMLEILRKMSQSSDKFQHHIIFLFNGAEEIGMRAAYGFIKQHKWFSGVEVVINLEANGAGGQILLFQTGPRQPWLLDYYKKVPYPHASVLGEELFQSGLIRTNTDYSVFVYDGNIVGLDFAFIKNGQRYHTKYDAHKNIPLGSYQHVGANTLNLVRRLANAPELQNATGVSQNMVFYDFYSLFLTSYTETVGMIINATTSIISIAIAVKSFINLRSNGCSTIVYILLSMGAILMGWILAAGLVIGTAITLYHVGFSMSWYANSWILSGLYVAPTFAACGVIIVVLNFFYKNNQNPSSQAQIQAHCMRVIWTILLLIGTFVLKLRTSYLILVPVFFQTITFIIIHIGCLQNSMRKWQILYVVGTILPNLFLMQQAMSLIIFIIPQFGRYDTLTNVELYIGVISYVLTILICSCYVPLITLVRKSYILLLGLFGMYLVFIIIVFTPLGFPYSGNLESPAHQRFTACQLTLRSHNYSGEIYKQEAVYAVNGQDVNFYKTFKYITDFKAAERGIGSNECGNETYWGAVCIPAVKPSFPNPLHLLLITKDDIGNATIRFSFQLLGSYRTVLYIKPHLGASLVNSNLPLSKEIEENRTIHSVSYRFGRETTLTFWVDIQKDSKLIARPLFELTVKEESFYKRNGTKNEYDELLEQFPEWTDVVPYMSNTETWIY